MIKLTSNNLQGSVTPSEISNNTAEETKTQAMMVVSASGDFADATRVSHKPQAAQAGQATKYSQEEWAKVKFTSKLVIVCSGSGCISSMTFFALGIVKAYDLNQRTIGVDALTTCLFAVGASFFWLFTLCMFYLLLQSQLNQIKIKEDRLKARLRTILTKAFPLCGVISTLASVSCFFMLIDGQSKELIQALATCHFLFVFFALLLMGGVSWLYFLAPLRDDLEGAISMSASGGGVSPANGSAERKVWKEKCQKILAKVKAMIFAIQGLLGGNLPLIFVFAVVPQVQMYSTYQLAALVISSPIFQIVSIHMFLPS